jgi:hypothetical protein
MVHLKMLGSAAEPTLRQVLKGRPTPEVLRRVEQLLERLKAPSESLRPFRAVEVLEHIGSTEARQVLEALSQGAAEARLTQEAKASLERLAKRPMSKP